MQASQSGLGESRYHEALGVANRQLETVRAILADVLPDVSFDKSLEYLGARSEQEEAVHRAIGKLLARQEMEQNWPRDQTIEIDTSQLHPWAWEPAKALWPIEKYREALQTATVTVNARMQQKLDRDDMEFGPLARNAFNLDPPDVRNPRLRLVSSEDSDKKTYENLHRGAAALGDYVFTVWPEHPVPQRARSDA